MRKHPKCAPPTVPNNQSISIEATIESIRYEIRKFRRDASGGLKGMNGQHLRDLLDSNSSYQFVDKMRDFINTLFRGRIDNDILPVLNGARLIAAYKDEKGLTVAP